MTNLEKTEVDNALDETPKGQFDAVMRDAAKAIGEKNRSDLVMALEHARAIAGQLKDEEQKEAWSKIDVYERELSSPVA